MQWSLTEEQVASFKAWDEVHKCKGAYGGAIGGRLTFSFTSTSLGQVAKVTCGLCGEGHDMTDYDAW